MDGTSGNWAVGGIFRALGAFSATNLIKNSDLSATADIDASKCKQHYVESVFQSGTAADATLIIHIAKAAGTITHFDAANVTECVNGTVTVDLQKNGVSCLAEVITLDNDTGDLGTEEGTLNGTQTYADGDVLAVVIDATAGTAALATGVFAQVHVDEAYPV